MKKKIIRIGSKRKTKLTKKERLLTGDIQTKVELIQALIPLGLMAVSEQLEEEVEELSGERYSRNGGKPGHCRWGSQPGSVYLSDQKVGISVPRVRNVVKKEEVPLESYRLLQEPRNSDEGVLRRFYWVCHVATTRSVLSRCLRLLGFLLRRSQGDLLRSVPASSKS